MICIKVSVLRDIKVGFFFFLVSFCCCFSVLRVDPQASLHAEHLLSHGATPSSTEISFLTGCSVSFDMMVLETKGAGNMDKGNLRYFCCPLGQTAKNLSVWSVILSRKRKQRFQFGSFLLIRYMTFTCDHKLTSSVAFQGTLVLSFLRMNCLI